MSVSAEQYSVVTSYADHPTLGDWESVVRRPMTKDEAWKYLSNKLVGIMKRGDRPALGRFVGLRVEKLHDGYEWDGMYSCCQRRDCKSPAREALADVIGTSLAGVIGVYDTTRSEDLALAQAILDAGYSKD